MVQAGFKKYLTGFCFQFSHGQVPPIRQHFSITWQLESRKHEGYRVLPPNLLKPGSHIFAYVTSGGGKTRSKENTIHPLLHAWAHRHPPSLWSVRVSKRIANFALLAPGHGWLWHHQDSNSRSPDDRANTFLSYHLANIILLLSLLCWNVFLPWWLMAKIFYMSVTLYLYPGKHDKVKCIFTHNGL